MLWACADSFQALSVMSAIKNLTRNGRTVVAR